MATKIHFASDRLRFAHAYAMHWVHNPINVRSRLLRQSLPAANHFVAQSLAYVLSLVESGTVLRNKDLLISAFGNAHTQTRILHSIQRVAFRDDYPPDPKAVSSLCVEPAEKLRFGPDSLLYLLKGLQPGYTTVSRYLLTTAAIPLLLASAAAALGISHSLYISEEIRRSIVFPPEFKQAGISVLSYFSHILKHKYPDTNVGVTIEQNGDLVTLVIRTPEGHDERIERELTDYGLVVAGQMKPDDYLADPLEVIALKNKLDLAAVELRNTRELLYVERGHFEKRLEVLEEQGRLMRNLLDSETYNARMLVQALTTASAEATPVARAAIERIVALVEQGPSQQDKSKVVEELATVAREDLSIVAKLEDLLVKGAIQGTAGNFVYACLQALAASFR